MQPGPQRWYYTGRKDYLAIQLKIFWLTSEFQGFTSFLFYFFG